MKRKMPIASERLSQEAHEFYDTFFQLLGDNINKPGYDTSVDLADFMAEHRQKFIDMILQQPSNGFVYAEWKAMLDKYLSGWLDE